MQGACLTVVGQQRCQQNVATPRRWVDAQRDADRHQQQHRAQQEGCASRTYVDNFQAWLGSCPRQTSESIEPNSPLLLTEVMHTMHMPAPASWGAAFRNS